jgi:hypothetical protein
LSIDIKDKHGVIATLIVFMALCGSGSPGIAQAGAHVSLPGPFTTLAEANLQCVSCHKTQADDIRKGVHWSWDRERVTGNQTIRSQKATDLTRFGLAAAVNPAGCRRCHISSTPLSGDESTGVNCLVCHDTTGFYLPDIQGEALAIIVRAAGMPTARNCQTCHDRQCGLAPDSDKATTVDVHITQHGFTCQSCHPGNGHHNLTRTMANTTGGITTKGCVSCHSQTPHTLARLNQHATLIACQSCHIPAWANNSPAVISWNWLLSNSQETSYQAGNTLLTDQGFLVSQDITPLFFWDNGADEIYTRGERIQPEQTTRLQAPAPRTPASKIMPFSVHYGTQFYDSKYRYLISPKLSLTKAPFLQTPERTTSISEGMKAIRLPYSGQYGITTTVSYRRINHGVAETDKALDCMNCHGSSSIFNWQNLGYEKDPWASQAKQPAPVMQKEISTIELPPIQESVLPIEDKQY